MLQYVVILGVIANIIGGYTYIRATFLGQTKPNRISWFLWGLVPAIAFTAGVSDGATWALTPVFMSGFIPLMIFIFSLTNKNAYWKVSGFDYACGMFSVIAIVMWHMTSQPLLAVIFAIIADTWAGIPTLVKAWAHPETESGGPFLGGMFSQTMGLIAAKTWAFTEVGFIVYLILFNIAIVTGIYWKKAFRAIWPS